jgi:hypothetical protein
VDAFEIGVLAVVFAAVVSCCLAARASAGKHLSEFGGHARRARDAAAAAAAEDAADLQDMLAVTNARRRARGLPERSVADAIREFGGE